MIDAMDELKRKLNRMSSNSSYAEVSDSDYLDVLTELYEQLKYAQERIVHLEREIVSRTDPRLFDPSFR